MPTDRQTQEFPKTDGMKLRESIENIGDKGRLKIKLVVGKKGTIETKIVRDYAKGA